MILYLLLMLLDMHEVLLFTFLMLEVVYIAADLILIVALSSVHVRSNLVLEMSVGSLAHQLLFFLLSLTILSFSSYLHVSLSCTQNVRGTLLGLIELLPSLSQIKLCVPNLPSILLA